MKGEVLQKIYPVIVLSNQGKIASVKRRKANFLCSVCGVKAIYVCSACKLRHYCCHLHQRKDWKRHRIQCLETIARNSHLSSGLKSRNIANLVVDRLQSCEVCIIDNFTGPALAENILQEVKQLHASEGVFTRGTCLSMMRGDDIAIRGDDIAWLSGTEEDLPGISEFVDRLNRLIVSCTNSNSSQDLDCKIVGRSKVMLSRFPGNGSCYKLHIDNPCRTGHILAAQLFLNRDYDPAQAGGLLRVQRPGRVVDIEPKLDRLVLHWADNRTPHEVLPVFKDRFSITVWYSGVQNNTVESVIVKSEVEADQEQFESESESEPNSIKSCDVLISPRSIDQVKPSPDFDSKQRFAQSQYPNMKCFTKCGMSKRFMDLGRRGEGSLMNLLSHLTDRTQAS